MKSGFGKIIIGMAVFAAMFMVFSVKVHADNGNISISSASGTKGETVTVSVTVTADEEAMGQIGISYDTNYLEYVSDGTNGGVAGLILSVLNEIHAGQAQTINLNFVLKEAGTTSISVASNTQLLAVNGPDPENAEMNISTSNGTVTINAATTASNDNHLSGLTVSAVSQNGETANVNYIPSFSPEIFEYTAELSPNVTRLVVATTLSDAKATTQVSGTRIDVGNNMTTITVTAEDGSQSVYTIYTTRLAEGTTTAPPETSSEGETVPEEATTEVDRTPKLVEALGKYIIQDFTLTTIPEGFEEGKAVYNGQEIAVLKGISKTLTIVCLADDAQGTNIQHFIYNEASGAFNKMVNITSTQKIYTILPTDDGYAGPEGYTQTALEVDGDIVKAWIRQEGSEFYIVYAMNWNGESAFYVYDSKEQTLQRYVEGNKTETAVEEPPTENTEYLVMKRQYDELNDEYTNEKSKRNKIILTLITILVIVLIIAALIIIKLTSDKRPDYLLDTPKDHNRGTDYNNHPSGTNSDIHNQSESDSKSNASKEVSQNSNQKPTDSESRDSFNKTDASEKAATDRLEKKKADSFDAVNTEITNSDAKRTDTKKSVPGDSTAKTDTVKTTAARTDNTAKPSNNSSDAADTTDHRLSQKNTADSNTGSEAKTENSEDLFFVTAPLWKKNSKTNKHLKSDKSRSGSSSGKSKERTGSAGGREDIKASLADAISKSVQDSANTKSENAEERTKAVIAETKAGLDDALKNESRAKYDVEKAINKNHENKEPPLIDMEEDAPFEIEFVDLDDNK